MQIRETGPDDEQTVYDIHDAAFGARAGLGHLTLKLLNDPSAVPRLSLLAMDDTTGRGLGHILLTNAHINARANIMAAVLAPLAVTPNKQRKGLGTALIEAGIRTLSDRGTGLVFVLGDPTYYGRFEFNPAIPLGFKPPYPISDEQADAWRVRDLRSGRSHQTGTLICADTLMNPALWRID